MTVRVVGDGPAVEAVRAALADVDATVAVDAPDDVGDSELADAALCVVAGEPGAEVFQRATDHAEHWVAVELGGVGGRAVADVEAAVAGFAPGTACYRCLEQRVAATSDGDDEPEGELDGETDDDADSPESDADSPESGAGDGASDAHHGAPDAATARLAGAIAGREVARALGGQDRLAGSVIELPHARREVLPVPGCACARAADAPDARSLPIPREHVDRGVEETVARMDRAVDERVGLVEGLGEADSFPAPYYLATLADTAPFSDGAAPEQAAGVADDWNAALAKAVGESLERYAAAVYRGGDFLRAPPAALEGAVAPAAFAGAPTDAPGAAAEQPLPWVEGQVLVADGEVRWPEAAGDGADLAADGGEDGSADAGGRDPPEPHAGGSIDDWGSGDSGASAGARGGDVASGRGRLETADGRVRLPASAVHFPPPDDGALPGITTGLGLGSSPVGALRSGLTEVIERDAAMLSWYSTFEPLELVVEDPAFERLARRARGEGLSVTPLLLTQDVDVPVVAVALHREEEWPQFAVAADAALDPVAAATGALEEAIQNWMELRSTGREAATDLSAAIGEYADSPEPARAFLDVETAVRASDVGPGEPPTGADAVDELLAALAAADLDAYAARLTTRDLAALGFEAVRVVVPDAQPLFTRSPRFGKRARSVPEELGFEPDLEREYHPYP